MLHDDICVYKNEIFFLIESRLTVLDEDKFGFDFIGEYRLPLKTLIKNETNHFNILLEEKQEVIVDFLLEFITN